ncbi:hypothetical protein ZOSMA_96G00680 [Zostera marina]|uniref:Uncharacterized protein n=1 Tax=Zostera marina TaxID=29655 RepID=A0A0K9NJY2_ZOSMR|nr:hypothetical protein ZOSMA_96G00680 [Zostera marina]
MIDGHFIIDGVIVQIMFSQRRPSAISNIINGHFIIDGVIAQILLPRPRPSTISNMINGHFIIDDVNVNRVRPSVPHPRHDRRRNLVNTLDYRHMLFEEIISKYLRKSQANSSQKNSSCSICQEQILKNETIAILD